MEKHNQTENQTSLFTEIELDEAEKVNGGLGSYPYQLYSTLLLAQNPSNFRLRNTLPRRGSGDFSRFDRNTNAILSNLGKYGGIWL